MKLSTSFLVVTFFLLLGLYLISTSDVKATGLDKLETYGNTLFNITNDFVTTNSLESPQDVVNFINSSSTTEVFSDALSSGYERPQILFETYQISFKYPQNIITQGLHDMLESEKKVKVALSYAGYANMGVTTLLLPMIGRFLWVYLKQDRPLLQYYKANAHKYMTGNLINTDGTNTASAPIATTPLLEPFMRPAGAM